MPAIALISATLLVLIGLVSYVNGTPNPDTGVVSPTALIPAFIGGVLGLCGVVALSDGLRKHAMHAAAMVGLLGALGGFMPVVRSAGKPGGFNPLAPSVIAGFLTVLVSGVFVALCVKSFVDARKARAAREAAAPPA